MSLNVSKKHIDHNQSSFYFLGGGSTVLCALMCQSFRRKTVERTFNKFLQARSHHVYVLDSQELELDVRVEVLVLITLTRRPVRHCVDLQYTMLINTCKILMTPTLMPFIHQKIMITDHAMASN